MRTHPVWSGFKECVNVCNCWRRQEHFLQRNHYYFYNLKLLWITAFIFKQLQPITIMILCISNACAAFRTHRGGALPPGGLQGEPSTQRQVSPLSWGSFFNWSNKQQDESPSCPERLYWVHTPAHGMINTDRYRDIVRSCSTWCIEIEAVPAFTPIICFENWPCAGMHSLKKQTNKQKSKYKDAATSYLKQVQDETINMY